MNEPSKQRPYWRYHCSVTYVTQQWKSYHENFSFIVTQLTSQSNDDASQNENKWKFQWRKRRTVLFSQNKSHDEPEWRCWPESPLQQPNSISGGTPIRFLGGV